MDLSLISFNENCLAQTFEWINDLQIATPFGIERRFSWGEHKAWFDTLLCDNTQSVWAVYDAKLGHLGNIGFKSIDRQHRRAEFWIYLGKEHWGKGLGATAVALAQEHAFDRLGLRKLYLHVNPTNAAAVHAYEKNGFVQEGILADELEDVQGRHNMLRFGCREAEWRRQHTLGPRVCLMQPTFLSWIGYYELLDQVDLFVFLDDFQFSRQGWGQRNRLLFSTGNPQLVTLPIKHPENINATFLQVTPAYTSQWVNKFLRSLQQNYGKAPYFARIFPIIEDWLAQKYSNISEMLTMFTKITAAYLGIHTKTICSSDLRYERQAPRSLKIASLLETTSARAYYSPFGSLQYMQEDAHFPLKNVPTYFQSHKPLPYTQLGRQEFIPYLSVVDALMNISPSQVRRTMRATKKWLSWEDAVDKISPTLNEG